MEEKVRILSFQNAQNYGAILQAYGLMKVIEDLGYEDVLFINYNPKYLSNRYSIFTKRFFDLSKFNFVTKIKFLLTIPFAIISRLQRNRNLNKSRKRMLRQTSKEYRSLSDFIDVECNFLICGSDQIWSTWITGAPDPVFYGEGKYKDIQRKFTYAPSTEMSTFEKEDNLITIKKLLKNFDSLSVREQSVQKIIRDLSGREVEICIDPTILCGQRAFSTIAESRIEKGKYILVYAYNLHDKKIMELIRTIPSYERYKIHYLCFGTSGLKDLFNPYIHSGVSVEKYLSFFKYADYIVTNSFHGLAFSLLFEKQFNVFCEKGLSGRIESLLNQLSLGDRLINSTENISWDNIDYETVNKQLISLRKQSLSFLSDNLNMK